MSFLLILIAVVIIYSISIQPVDEENEHSYTASFGNPHDHFGSFNQGFAIGNLALTRMLSHNNAACFGPTGSGKTSSVILPSIIALIRGRSSVVLNDASGGELYRLTSRLFKRNRYRIFRFNFSDAKNSETFNPLLFVKSISDAQKTALIIIRNTIGESKSDPFWENSSVMLISLFIRYLVFHTEEKYRTLQNVLRLLETFSVDGKAISKLILQTKDEHLLQNYKATIVMGEKTLQSVISTSRTALNLWNDSDVYKTTATNSLTFELLREEPVVIYVTTPLKDITYLKPLTTLFFQTLFNYVLTTIPPKNSRSIFFVLEESATMTFPNLNTTISNIRKFSSGILLCMQDEQALVSQYGQAAAHEIKTNCGCQIYLRGQPLHTCKELSQILGRYSYGEEDKKTRELLTADELRMCPDAIVLLSNNAPLRCEAKPFYESIWHGHLANATPLELPVTIIEEPPLIPLS